MEVIDGRRSMRALIDAAAKLSELGDLAEPDNATVRTFPMQLPDGSVVSTIAVIGPGAARRIMLAAAVAFMARETNGERRERAISELDEASLDADGNVQLQDGSYVHAVELIPVDLHTGPETEREVAAANEHKRLLLDVLEMYGLRQQCYRALDGEFAADITVLDYALVRQVGAENPLPTLKEIERDLRRRGRTIDRETLANVLARAGLRSPRSGKRAPPR